MSTPLFAFAAESLIALSIPIIAIIMGIGLAIAVIYLNYRKRKEIFALYHQERMAALDKGVDLPPLPDALLTDEAWAAKTYHPRRHLLKGLVWLFMGLGLLAGLYAVVDWKTSLFALIPAGIGLAHLIYYFVEGRNIPKPENQPQPDPATRL